MLKGFRIFCNSVCVHSSLMCKSRSAHIRHCSSKPQVCNLTDIAGCFRKLFHIFGVYRLITQLQLQIRYNRRKVCISAALSYTRKCALNMLCSRLYRSYCSCNSAAVVVVTVYSCCDTCCLSRSLYRLTYLVGKSAAVGVAEAESSCSRLFCGFKHLDCVIGISLVAVKEMLSVKYYPPALRRKIKNSIIYHFKVSLKGCS